MLLSLTKFFPQKKVSTLVGLLLSCLFIFFHIKSNFDQQHWLHRLDYLLFDMRLNSSLAIKKDQSLKPEQPIIILDIDEKSLAEQGRWPWSRQVLAELLQSLQHYQVSIVAFDVVFPEPERNLLTTLNKHLAQHDVGWQAPLQWQKYVDGDFQFAQEIAKVDTVLGFFFQSEANVKVGQLPKPVYQLQPKELQKLVVLNKPGFAANLPQLQQQAVSAGFVSTISDSDGSIRRSPLLIRHEDGLYPSLGLATAMGFLLLDEVAIETSQLNQVEVMSSVKLDSLTIATDASGRVIVPYIGPRNSYPYYSLTDVLKRRVPTEVLEGAIVLVGTSAIGLSDLRPTPMGTQYPGVEVHANIINALLKGDFPYRPDWHSGATLAVMILLAALLSLWLPGLGPISSIVISSTSILLVVISNFYLWHGYGLDLPVAAVILLVLSLTLFNMAYGFIRENQNKKVIKGMFTQYVPPAHIDRMLSDPDAYNFSGESKELTVLFSDIRSFTSISENLSASELKSLLNEYFTPITKVIFDNDGTIDKYVGDMVMAFWGAPIDDEQHATRAVKAALEMLEKTEQLSQAFVKKGWPEIKIGVGLNTGLMNVGDMGSSYRRAYTVLGDAVNLGSRLESITKFYGVPLLIGEKTCEQVQGYCCRFIDCIQVKGKDEPIKVFQPVCLQQDASDELLAEIQLFDDFYQCYLQQDWQRSVQLLNSLIESYKDTKLYKVYLSRIEELKLADYQKNWDGVYRHTEK